MANPLGGTYIYTFQANEFTESNYYILSFEVIFGDSWFVFGHNPNLSSLDGLFISNHLIRLYVDGELVDEIVYNMPYIAKLKIVRQGTKFSLQLEDVELYNTDRLSWNTVGTYNEDSVSSTLFEARNFILEPYVVTDITPSVATYDGSVFGSDLHLEVRNDHLNLIDYGMLPNGAIGSGKVLLNDVPLPTSDLELELEMKYNNVRFERLNNLTGQIQMRVYEDIIASDNVKEYSQVLCSPMPVANVQTVFTRHSEEGILYYVKDPKQTGATSPTYLCNAYTQYKGGVEIKSETGISLFNLDNAFSPVLVGNNLVRAEFHRRSGYVKLERYDENSNQYYAVNILKIKSNPQLKLVEYNDDYCELQFGKTTWKFYRGRPFIIVNHKEDDLRVLHLVDRVYCETFENNRGLGFIEEHNTNEGVRITDDESITQYSTFNPQISIQQFKQELHIGENIRTDNFEVYDVEDGYLGDKATNVELDVVQVEDDNALIISKTGNTGKVALNFPSYSSYVKKVGDTFTLSIDYVNASTSNSTIPFVVKARGFDDRGAVPIVDGIQYGVWEQTQTVSVDTTELDNIRVTFTNCPDTVKYIDFIIIFNTTNSFNIKLKDFMYYQGDSVLNHDVDNSIAYAEQVNILFSETYYVNLYNEDDPFGLCVIRPNQHTIGLRNIYASEETVFAPYMKKASEWDKPSQVFLEYLNSKRQIIDIDWEN